MPVGAWFTKNKRAKEEKGSGKNWIDTWITQEKLDHIIWFVNREEEKLDTLAKT